MSSISFNEIPNNIRKPIFSVEFDNSNAIRGAQNQKYQSLIVGQKLAAGTVDHYKPVRVASERNAENFFGAGSMLAEKAKYYLLTDPVSELWAIAVPDDSSAVQATAIITVTGTAETAGTLYCYVNGTRVTVAVRMGDGPTMVLSRIADAINAVASLPVVAYATTDKVTLEVKFAGEAGNDIDLRFNYYDGEYFPTGIAVNAVPFSGGATNPDVSQAIATIGGEWFNSISSPYTDLNNLQIFNDYLKDCWGPLVMRDGFLIGAKRGTFGQLCDFGNARNSHVESFTHCTGIPNSPWAVAASVAANVMRYGNMDPARQFQTLPLVGILPARMEDRFSDFPESNLLLYNGISTLAYPVGGSVIIDRVITTYKTAANGAEDESYLGLNTGLTLGYLRWDLRNYFMRKYPRHKLADDGNLYEAGQPIMTPKLAKAECVNVFEGWVKRGLVENIKQFKDELVVVRNAANRCRLDYLLPPDLVNQLIVNAAQIRFYL